MKKVELLTCGVWHFSVGDFARYEATSFKLAEAGIGVMPVSIPTGNYPVIVDLGNQSWSWMSRFLKPIYANDEIRQPFALNAMALPDKSVEIALVKDCSYLSFRDQYSASIVEAYTYAHNDFRRLSKLVNKVIPIDSRPWETRDWKGSGRVFPLTHSAQILMSIISKAEVVVTCSLHIGILALAAGTPFVVYDVNNKPREYPIVKSVRYWERAEFPEVIYHGKEPIEYALSLKEKMLQVRREEFEKAEAHIQSLLRYLALSVG